jgi:predicted GIY-YIG superfamily endonuclease
VSNRTYIGYTIDFSHRIRQHNGEIKGGAKKTQKWRPWSPVCVIEGFYDASSALRFEYRLQHPGRRKKAGENAITFTLQNLVKLISSGDGSIAKDNKMPWPLLQITWHLPGYSITHPQIINRYAERTW